MLWELLANPCRAQGEHSALWLWVPACARVPWLSPAQRSLSGVLLCSDKAKEAEGNCPCGQESCDSRSQRELGDLCCLQQLPACAGRERSALPGSRMGEQLALLTQLNAHLTQLHLQLPGKDQPAMAPCSAVHTLHHERWFNSFRGAGQQKCLLWGGMLSSWNAGPFWGLRKVSCGPCIKLNLIFGSKFAF